MTNDRDGRGLLRALWPPDGRLTSVDDLTGAIVATVSGLRELDPATYGGAWCSYGDSEQPYEVELSREATRREVESELAGTRDGGGGVQLIRFMEGADPEIWVHLSVGTTYSWCLNRVVIDLAVPTVADVSTRSDLAHLIATVWRPPQVEVLDSERSPVLVVQP